MMSSPFPTLAVCLTYVYLVKVSSGASTWLQQVLSSGKHVPPGTLPSLIR